MLTPRRRRHLLIWSLLLTLLLLASQPAQTPTHEVTWVRVSDPSMASLQKDAVP